MRKNYTLQRSGRFDDKEEEIELKKTIFDKFYDQFSSNFIILEKKNLQELKALKKREMEEKEANKNKKKTESEKIEEQLKQLEEEKAQELLKNQIEVPEKDLVPQEIDLKQEPDKD